MVRGPRVLSQSCGNDVLASAVVSWHRPGVRNNLGQRDESKVRVHSDVLSSRFSFEFADRRVTNFERRGDTY